MVEPMRAEGAAGYLPKGSHAETVLAAIRAACLMVQS
jgi:DNA-binding NarL/FixJ family response regulator